MKRWKKILLMLAAAVLAPVVYFQVWTLTGRVATVDRGRLYRSAALPAERLAGLCRQHGITTVVDLRTEPTETAAEATALRRAGITHVSLPTGQVPTSDVVARFLQLMDEKHREPVLIHCAQGYGRSGVFTAIYRMEYQGWSNRRAMLEEIVVFGATSFWPGTDKGRFLSAYKPRRPAVPGHW